MSPRPSPPRHHQQEENQTDLQKHRFHHHHHHHQQQQQQQQTQKRYLSAQNDNRNYHRQSSSAHSQQPLSMSTPNPPSNHPNSSKDTAHKSNPVVADNQNLKTKPTQSTTSNAQSSIKASQNTSFQLQESTRGRLLTYQELSCCFHLPINSAARELGVCVTALKKQCRKHGVQRWPHRKLKSLDKLKEKLEKEEATAADKEYYKHEIHSIVQKKDHIFRANPASRDPASSQNPPSASAPNAIATSNAPGASSSPQIVPPPDYHHNSHTSPNLYVSGPPEHNTPLHSHQPPYMVGAPIPVGTSSNRNSSQLSSHNGNSAMISPLAVPGPHMSLCGIIGCDCYLNGGVSSHNLHMPLPLRTSAPNQAHMSNPSPMLHPPPNPHGTTVPNSHPGGPTAPPYYGVPPPGYTYAAHLPYAAAAAAAAAAAPPPFHNMVQVNVMDHQTYHQAAAAAAAAAQPPVPMSQPMPPSSQSLITGTQSATPVIGNAPPTRTTHSSPHLVGPSTSPNPNYDVYTSSQLTQPVAPSPSVLYTGASTNGQASSSGGNNQQRLPTHYWTTDVGQTPGANNTFTMYNQSTHFHHHHTSGELGANAPIQTCSSREGAHDTTTSSATNNHHEENAKSAKETHASENEENGKTEATSTQCLEKTEAGTSDAAKSTAFEGLNAVGETVQTGDSSPIFKEFVRNSESHMATGMVSENEVKTNGLLVSVDAQQTSGLPEGNWTRNGKTNEKEGPHRQVSSTKRRRRAERREVTGPYRPNANQDFQRALDDEKRRNNYNPKSSENRTGAAQGVAEKTEVRSGKQNSKRPRSVTREETVGGEGVRKNEPWPRTSSENSRVNHTSANRNIQSNRFVQGVENSKLPENHNSSRMKEAIHEGSSASGRGKDVVAKRPRILEGQTLRKTMNEVTHDQRQRNCGLEDPPSPRVSNGHHRNNAHIGRIQRDWEKVNAHTNTKLGKSTDGKVTCNGIDSDDVQSNGEDLEASAADGTSGTVQDATPSACFKTRARRYESVVHGCVAVGCAQWCTDKCLRVTAAIGAKALLAMLGVGSIGRNVLDGQSDAMVENAHDLRRRYGSAVKGQRSEWTVSQGRRRFVIIVAPFRKKSGADICGVSGIILELTHCWDLLKRGKD